MLIAVMTIAIVVCYDGHAVFSVPTNAKSFHDVPMNHWAYAQIMEITDADILDDFGDDTFRPDEPVSYADFSMTLARAIYGRDLADCITAASNSEVVKVVIEAHGILSGTRLKSGEAAPLNMLTRDDMAMFLYNILIDCDVPLPSDDEISAAQAAIQDFSSITPSRCDAVAVCYALGLLSGRRDGTFGPMTEMTRAQAAVVVSRLLRCVGQSMTSAEKLSEESSITAPGVSLPELKMLPGETAQTMMDRINAATQPYVEGQLTNGKPVTEENIQEMLKLIKRGFPDGMPWDDQDIYQYLTGSFGGYACAAFAAAVSDSIFGEDAPVRKHHDYEHLQVGDVVWLKNFMSETWHAFVVTSVNLEAGTYTSCSGNNGKHVRWNEGRLLSVFGMTTTVVPHFYIYSRY